MGGHRRHEAMYGPLTEFGYHDFIPMFKAERFNAEEWATLFFESGARFAGIVGEHHDGFSMWASEHTPFNVKDMGPRRDVLGEIEKAVKGRGMKFFVSLHHENNYTYVKVKPHWAANNPKYQKLYGCLMPHNEWLEMWLNKCNEVVSKYSPDIVYFDAWMDQIPEKYKLNFLSNYFNLADKQGKDVVVTYKNEDLPRSIAMLDHEMRKTAVMDSEPWLCDFTIADGYHRSWGYVKGMQVMSHKDIIHMLIKIVSNNGCLLLNLSPMSDGTFPQNQKDVVANVGVWLWSYGESIYDTRPYVIQMETLENGTEVYFTRKENSVYAIMLNWPGNGLSLDIKSLGKKILGKDVTKATLLSVKRNYDCPIIQHNDKLEITIPNNARRPSDVASVIRFDL